VLVALRKRSSAARANARATLGGALSVDVTLDAEGMAEDVDATLRKLAEALGTEGTVWVKQDFPREGGHDAEPREGGHDAEHEQVQLHFEAEVSEADGRADAHARVIEAVKQVDPEFAVIKGGDIFNRAL
jgi:hypothetical protein